MKKIFFSTIFLGLVIAGLTSCGSKSSTSDLTVTMAPQDGMLLDLPIETCESHLNRETASAAATPPSAVYVAGPKVLFHKLKLKWAKSYKLIIVSATIDVHGNGFEAKCTLSPNEFNALFLSGDVSSTNSTYFDKEGFIENGKGTVTSNPACKIFCPVTLKDPNNLALSGSGTITIKAVAEIKKNTSTDEVTYMRVTGTGQLRVMP